MQMYGVWVGCVDLGGGSPVPRFDGCLAATEKIRAALRTYDLAVAFFIWGNCLQLSLVHEGILLSNS